MCAPNRKKDSAVLLVVLSLLLVLETRLLPAQIPDTFKNLQVLPKDIGKQELVAMMRSFAGGLGVRCQHCHIGEEGKSLSEFDFVSDEKNTKQTARIMMRMVQALNQEHLPKIAARASPPMQVNCVTCHRGQNRPRMLEEILLEAILAQGVQAGIQEYRTRREKYYGSFVFDFRERVLLNLAQQLQATGKNDDALEMLKLNSEFYPDSWMNHLQMAELYLAKGEKILAIAHYKKSLASNPNNPPVQKKLEELLAGE